MSEKKEPTHTGHFTGEDENQWTFHRWEDGSHAFLTIEYGEDDPMQCVRLPGGQVMLMFEDETKVACTAKELVWIENMMAASDSTIRNLTVEEYPEKAEAMSNWVKAHYGEPKA